MGRGDARPPHCDAGMGRWKGRNGGWMRWGKRVREDEESRMDDIRGA